MLRVFGGEYVPIIAAGARIRANTDLGTRQTFADLGQTRANAIRLFEELFIPKPWAIE